MWTRRSSRAPWPPPDAARPAPPPHPGGGGRPGDAGGRPGACGRAGRPERRAVRLMQRSTPQSIRRRAEELDEGEAAVLSASLAAAIASLGAVVWYMASHREPVGPGHVALALVTIGLSWVFVHLLFAVR